MNGRGFRRVPSGRGFSYRYHSGETVTDPTLRQRLNALAIPPAWSDVWISPYENGHVLATGIDVAGRRQYIYHPSWRERMDRLKYDRALGLAESLPAARRVVTRDLARPEPDRRRALAMAFRILDQASLRVGSERYAQEHGSRGLSTLLCSHARVSGADVVLEFPAKSGQRWSSTIHDDDLARAVRELKRRGSGARLLAFRDHGRWHPLSADDINAYVRERTGGDYTAKDFRTLHGSVAAAVELANSGVQPSAAARRRAISDAMKHVSEVLGNTPAIARHSYIDPRIIDAYENGEILNRSPRTSVELRLRSLICRR
jgi:DNA topoisomerase-1